MGAENSTDDYWLMAPAAPEEQAKPNLSIEFIDGVEPLDAQFGVDRPKTVPDALFDLLFGKQRFPHEESERANVAPAKLPSAQTYAILDAARMPRLEELLADSALEYRCLFNGAACDELKDVAPWLVRLELNNSFSRRLFTAGPQPWVFWNTAPGIFIRTTSSFSQVWGHFRKFTKAKGESGKWFYFRFWEPIVLRDLPDCLSPTSFTKFLGTHQVISCLPDGTAMAMAVSLAPSQGQNLLKAAPHDP